MQLEHSVQPASRIARFWLIMRHLTLPPKPANFPPSQNTSLPCLAHRSHNYDLVAARPWPTTRCRALLGLTLTHFRAPDLEINLTSGPTNQRARGSIGSPMLVAYLCPMSPCCEDALRRVEGAFRPCSGRVSTHQPLTRFPCCPCHMARSRVEISDWPAILNSLSLFAYFRSQVAHQAWMV
jgi:hypothetical protein